MIGSQWAKVSKSVGGSTGLQLLDGGCWERDRVTFLGGLQLLHKNKLKSEIFIDEKNYKQKLFCHSNWEILPKNLVTFKR